MAQLNFTSRRLHRLTQKADEPLRNICVYLRHQREKLSQNITGVSK